MLLTAIDVRRPLREAIEIESPDIAVTCREELDEGLTWSQRRSLSWAEGHSSNPEIPPTSFADRR